MKYLSFLFCIVFIFNSCDKTVPGPVGSLQLIDARKGLETLLGTDIVVPVTGDIILTFSGAVSPESNSEITLVNEVSESENISFQNLDQNKIISISTDNELVPGQLYTLMITDKLVGENGETFPGIEIPFLVQSPPLDLISVSVGDQELSKTGRNVGIAIEPIFNIKLSDDISSNILEEEIVLVGDANYSFQIDRTSFGEYLLIPDEKLLDFSKVNLLLPSTIGDRLDRSFETTSYELFTDIDTNPKFPLISDEELLTLVQSQTFKYFWDFGHPVSGLARERNTSGEIVTTGGSGFGLMSMIVGVERGFVTRNEAIERWKKIFDFLESADRFHGAWSHWLNGSTGKVQPFSAKDNGADLVETAFLVQGMLTVRQYLNMDDEKEAELIEQINRLWEGVEWNWFQKDGGNVLYWHWSPEFEWDINLRISGHNETQIIYTLAAASPTYSITREVYENGYARNGNIKNGNVFYGHTLPLGSDRGGPLFFAHYSYLGMDPRNLEDQYANYWEQNKAHALINRAYCIDNPRNYVGYSEHCWGLTASDNNNGYSAHSPNNDLGVITPTAAIASIPYTPEESLDAIRHFYYLLGDRLWGEYGFYDAFNPTASWYASSFLAIDQGPIIVMIENYRTGLLWDLYMSAPEVQDGLTKLGFTY